MDHDRSPREIGSLKAGDERDAVGTALAIDEEHRQVAEMSSSRGARVIARLAGVEMASGGQPGDRLAGFFFYATGRVLVNMEPVPAFGQTAQVRLGPQSARHVHKDDSAKQVSDAIGADRVH